jgi:hypothetical protein
MRIKLQLTLKTTGFTKDIWIAPRYIDTDEPGDGLNRLYDDLLHYISEHHHLDIVATLE